MPCHMESESYKAIHCTVRCKRNLCTRLSDYLDIVLSRFYYNNILYFKWKQDRTEREFRTELGQSECLGEQQQRHSAEQTY